MTSVRVAGRFSLVFLVFNTIDNLTTQQAQVACFKNAALHLASGGRFLVETQVPPLQKVAFGETRLAFVSEPGHFGVDVFDFAKEGRIDFLIYSRVIRPMPIVLLVIFIYFYKKNKKFFTPSQRLKSFIILFFLTILSLILVSPTGVARWQSATLYIPFIIIFTRIWEKPYIMPASLLGGLYIVFPFFDDSLNSE